MDIVTSAPGGNAAGAAGLTVALLTAAAWLLVGLGVGYGIRRLTVFLTYSEKMEPGFERWQVWGPPLLTAALFSAFGFHFAGDWILLLIKSLWVAVLVQVIFFDSEHKLILDKVMFPAMAAAIALSLVTPYLGLRESLLTGIGAGLIFLLLAIIGSMLFGADALGFGDVKLVAFLGLIIGIHKAAIVTSLFLGVLFAGVISLLLVVFRVRSMKDAIPYGPFLAAGALVVLFQLGAK